MFGKRGFAIVGLLAAMTAAAVYVRSRPQPISLLLITLDTTRADRLGCYGYDLAQTPTLDELAAKGILFERAYAPVPITLPSHASLLTGLYPPEHGLHLNGQAALPGEIPTLATQLRSAGYETAAFVAAFVLDGKFGLARDFGLYDDDLSQSQSDGDEHHRYRSGERVADAALPWLKQRDDRPFFCWVHFLRSARSVLAAYRSVRSSACPRRRRRSWRR